MARQQKPELSETVPAAVAPKSLMERFSRFLDGADWHFDTNAEKGYVVMGCRIKDATVRVIADIFESEDWQRVVVFAVYPVFVPENRRTDVLDAMNRINHDLAYGNFEMDPADGEIRFRTSVESDGPIPEPMMDRVLHGNIAAADRHFGALMAVTFASTGPVAAGELASRPDNATLQ